MLAMAVASVHQNRTMENDAQRFEVHGPVESQGRGGLHAHMPVGVFFISCLRVVMGPVPLCTGDELVHVRLLAIVRHLWDLAGGSDSQADESTTEDDARGFEVIVQSLNGELARFRAIATDVVWDIKIKVKRRTGIPVHQQVLCLEAARLLGGQRLFDLLVGETMVLSLVRIEAACGHCCAPMTQGRFCTGCLEVVYCNRGCQRLHWAAHRARCCVARLEA